MIDRTLHVGGSSRQHHRPQVDVEDVTRDQLDPFVRHRVAAVAAVPRVVLLVGVGHRVRGRIALLRRRRDRHALRQPLADLPVDARQAPVRVSELLEPGRKEHGAHRVAAFEQRRRCDPGPTAGPTGDVRRVEQLLPQAPGQTVHVRHCRRGRGAELAIGQDDQLNRTLDLRPRPTADCRSRATRGSCAAGPSVRIRTPAGGAPVSPGARAPDPRVPSSGRSCRR